jgi:carboxymethylenebutenolidase
MRTETLDLDTTQGATSAHVALPGDEDAVTAAAAHAAIILIHEWWGLDDHVRDIAGRYAREGFVCVAPDLYRGNVTRDPQEASAFMHALALADGLATIRRAVEETERTYGLKRFGITGYCMGGTFALRAACEMETLGAAAPFYGDIPEEEVLARLSVPTLFIAGSRDQWITPAKVNGLREAAQKYSLPVETVSYDADHAFFNDTRPEVYNPAAAADAWRRVLAHFREYL